MFAIAITLLVLEIAVPAIEDGVGSGEVIRRLAEEWPVYLAYFVSFMTIGAVWIEHSALVDALDHIDGVFMRLNLVLLLFAAFLPFPTTDDERMGRQPARPSAWPSSSTASCC